MPLGLYADEAYLWSLRITLYISLQGDDGNSDSDEEPSPEALVRYLAMRRHTVGVGDTRHEVRWVVGRGCGYVGSCRAGSLVDTCTVTRWAWATRDMR